MLKIPDNCVEVVKHSRIVLEEESSKITFLNPKQIEVRKIRIDGCVIKEGIKCDYMIITIHNGYEYYIELKGSDVDHALKQIERTITLVSSNQQRITKHCFIISTRCPLASPKIQDIKIKFKKQYNANLIIKNILLEHTL